MTLSSAHSGNSPQETIVIYRLGSLGDTVVALPCFHAVARAWPRACRLVLTNIPVSSKAAPLEGILGGSGLIHGAMRYPVGTRSWRRLWALRAELRALGADTLVYLTPPRGRLAAWRDVAFFRLCGFRKIIGAPLRGDLQHCRPVNAQGHLEHEARRLARCLEADLPLELESRRSWDLRLTEAERRQGRDTLQALAGHAVMVLNMGGKLAVQDWGASRWEQLMAGLAHDHPHVGLLMVGAQEDAERADRVAALWEGPCVNACGRLTPRESAAAMEGARCFLGHDSGPLHLAAATGLPCIGLFGNHNPPGKWHPFGPGHRVLQSAAGIEDIAVPEVARQVRECLAALASQPPTATLTPSP